jgi:hypothetical protein
MQKIAEQKRLAKQGIDVNMIAHQLKDNLDESSALRAELEAPTRSCSRR